MTRSLTLQLKKPATIIRDAEGDDRCGQCEKVLFRICLRLSTSTKILNVMFTSVVLIFSLLHRGPLSHSAEVVFVF